MKYLLCLLLFASSVFAEVRITGETKAKRDTIVDLQAAGDITRAAFIWDCDKEELVSAKSLGGRYLFAAPPGSYKIKLRVVTIKDGVPQIDEARTTVTIGDEVPPGPTPPGPTPPGPKPDDKAPIPAPGFRVLIIEESKDRSKLSPGQNAIIFGSKVRDYLKAKCIKDTENPDGAFRIWDPNTATDGESKLWIDALKRSRSSLPWVIISNGVAGYEGPLPDSVTEMLTLLQKYGG